MFSHTTTRPSVVHSQHHARTFWAGALTLIALSTLVAIQYRAQDPDALLMRKYLIHALIGAVLLLVFGMYYQRNQPRDTDSQFFANAHFWLTFAGILGLMSHELLIPEATLGWEGESLNSPGYYFLHMVSQAVLVPIGGLLLLIGQGYFVYHLGVQAAKRPAPVQYLPNGEVAR